MQNIFLICKYALITLIDHYLNTSVLNAFIFVTDAQAFNLGFSVDDVCWITYYKTLSLLFAAAASVEVK